MHKKLIWVLSLALLLPTMAFAGSIDFGGGGGNFSWAGGATPITLTFSTTTINPAHTLFLGTAMITVTTGNYLSGTGSSGDPFLFSPTGSSIQISDDGAGHCNATAPPPTNPFCFNGGIGSIAAFVNTNAFGSNNLNLNVTLVGGTVDNYVLGLLGLPQGMPYQNVFGSMTATLNVGSGVDATHGGSGNGIGSTDIVVTQVPEPGSLLMFGTGLLGFGSLIRRKFRG